MGQSIRRRPLHRLSRATLRSRMFMRWGLPVAMLLIVLFGGTALAAETAGGDVFRLPRGEVIQDDFYVSGREIYIDGTVDGDLVAAGAYVEVNGVVTGDLIVGAGSVVVSGVVQDDARIGAGGIVISGNIGDDLFSASGGGWPGAEIFMAQFGAPGVSPGLQIASNAKVGGDAFVVGGSGDVEGTITGDLNAAFAMLRFAGRVSGGADLTAESLTIDPGSRVEGELRYSAPQQLNVPEAVSPSVQYDPTEAAEADEGPDTAARIGRWIARTLLILVGLAIVGWLVVTFAPASVARPAAALESRPAESAIYGLVAGVVAAPVAVALVVLAILFWGWFPGGVVMAAFLFGLIALVWIFSPLVTGLWVGRKLAAVFGLGEGTLTALLIGALVIALIGRALGLIPCVGPVAGLLLYLFSFAFAVGGWILARRERPAATVGAPVPQP